MRAAATAMQLKCQFAAKKAIPAALDWADEDRIWGALGFRVDDYRDPYPRRGAHRHD
jgi:hypothetical protein